MDNMVLTGDDVFKINDTIIDELANGETVSVTFPNDINNVEKGKNGIGLYAKNEAGSISETVFRVKRGGVNDRFLNNILNSMLNDLASFTLMKMEFIKRLGDGEGTIFSDTYVLKGGIFSKFPETRGDSTGSVEQAIAVYTVKCTSVSIIKG